MGLHRLQSNPCSLFSWNKRRKTTLGRRRPTHQAHTHAKAYRATETRTENDSDNVKCTAERSSSACLTDLPMDTRKRCRMQICCFQIVNQARHNKCVSYTHIRQTEAAVKTMCNTLAPFSREGNNSVVDCIPLSDLLLQVALLSQRGRAVLRVCQ